MAAANKWPLLFLVLLMVDFTYQAKKQRNAALTDIEDFKSFKKLLKTKTNILVLFINKPSAAKGISDVFRETANAMKGQATLVIIDCNSSDSKKLCKKLKVDSDKSYIMKHYKDGEFHKEYDRSQSLSSMSNFLRDPTGDLPWEEDPQAAAVVHLADGEALVKFLRKSAATNQRALILYYAPWCGYCKILKPEYVAAASELKGEASLAAIDVARPGNTKIRQMYNITGFPTILYFEKGQLRFPYNGENKKGNLVAFMKNPSEEASSKRAETEDSWSQDSDVVHLTEENFDKVLAGAQHALVVFYAPWCGHCKRIKPELERAAAQAKKENVEGVLAAVDATREAALAARLGVTGYPTLKYFSRGEYRYDAGHARTQEQIVSFIKSPAEPPPPPPPEQPWSDTPSAVRHLTAAAARAALRKVKHALVMFYAPWCGHCKSTKPEFMQAAEHFADELMVAFGAVDCTTETELCKNYNVTGYPTFKYFSHFDRKVLDYNGGRKKADFVSYISGQMSPSAPSASAAGFGASVRVLLDDTFADALAADAHTFVMFYATWCDHCTQAKPTYSRLATALKERNIQAVAIDAAENGKAADFAGIETLPTFKLYRKGKLVATYDGDRSYDHLMAFVTANAKVKDEL